LNDFAAALRDLNDAGVRYVIVGGLAVIRHGAVRATKDVDAAVAMDDENLARLGVLVELWQATNPDGTALRRRDLASGGALALRTRHCLVDILSEQLLPAPFAEVLSRADVKRIDGVPAPICSLADLVAMKRATGRAADELDLERLRDAHGELPGDPPTRDLTS
jgi:predicted nucleotidyltransferase